MNTISSVNGSYILLKDSLEPETSDIKETIAPYTSSLKVEMDVVVANSDKVMEKGVPESILGNFVSDLCMKIGNQRCEQLNVKAIDVCVLNSGGLRTSLPKGPITRRNVFELMPFENELVVLELTSKQMFELVAYIISYRGVPTSGIKMGFDTKSAIEVLVQGETIAAQQTYRVITSDYLASGGDNMTFFENLPMQLLDIKLRDAILLYMQQETAKGSVVSAQLDKRLYYVE